MFNLDLMHQHFSAVPLSSDIITGITFETLSVAFRLCGVPLRQTPKYRALEILNASANLDGLRNV